MADIAKQTPTAIKLKDTTVSSSVEKALVTELSAKKNAVLHSIVSAVPELVKEINKSNEGVYKVLCGPAGAQLTRKGEKLFQGVFRDKNGNIVKHADLQKLGPDPLSLASQYHSKLMLAQVVESLEEIKQDLAGLGRGLDDDRKAIVLKGISLYRDALLMEDSTSRRQQLLLANSALAEGNIKCLQAMKRAIESSPEPGFELVGLDKTKKAEKQFTVFFDFFHHYIIGVKTQALCYLVLEEKELAKVKILERLRELSQIVDDDLISKAKLLPPKKSVEIPAMPEKVLVRFKTRVESASERFQSGMEELAIKDVSFEIEVDQKTLLEIADAAMQEM